MCVCVCVWISFVRSLFLAFYYVCISCVELVFIIFWFRLLLQWVGDLISSLICRHYFFFLFACLFACLFAYLLELNLRRNAYLFSTPSALKGVDRLYHHKYDFTDFISHLLHMSIWICTSILFTWWVSLHKKLSCYIFTTTYHFLATMNQLLRTNFKKINKK